MAGTTVFEMPVPSSLTFLGLVAFLRCVEVAIDDWEFACVSVGCGAFTPS